MSYVYFQSRSFEIVDKKTYLFRVNVSLLTALNYSCWMFPGGKEDRRHFKMFLAQHF